MSDEAKKDILNDDESLIAESDQCLKDAVESRECGKTVEAEAYYERGLRIRMEVLGPGHETCLEGLAEYIEFLKEIERPDKAVFFAQALSNIKANCPG